RQLAIDPHRPSVFRLESEYGDLGSSPGLTNQPEETRNCQRTRTVLPAPVFQSRENVRLYLACFQPSAASPQPYAAEWCTAGNKIAFQAAVDAVVGIFQM
ncbi:MAG: hypothetical protein ACRD2Y_17015, partial [Terriglobales bacterium]